MWNDNEEEEGTKDFIEVRLKIPKPDEPKFILVPSPAPIHITNVTGDNTPNGQMKSSDYSTNMRVQKFGSILEKDAVQATQSFKRRGITIKDSRAS